MKNVICVLFIIICVVMNRNIVSAQQISVTLHEGWNWIAYSCPEYKTINEALRTLTPYEGDMIKGVIGYSEYQNGQWSGSLEWLMPGSGYLYLYHGSSPIQFSFTEPIPQLVVTTEIPSGITTVSATCGGSVASGDGGYVSISMRGICWSENPNPTINDHYVELGGGGVGDFAGRIVGLDVNTTYYVRAFAVTEGNTFFGQEQSFTTLDVDTFVPAGACHGKFSVSSVQQVYFSQGNLQFQASTNTWRFAEHQWDYVGNDFDGTVYENGEKCNNNHISSNYAGWIDLFGWGTSGYDRGAECYQPWSTSINDSDYDIPNYVSYDLSSWVYNGQADWGFNPISNGGDALDTWHTLTQWEWDYLLNDRITISGIRYAYATIEIGDDVWESGTILLPDDWDDSTYDFQLPNSNCAYTKHWVDASQWEALENSGAVFLPAAGYRKGTDAQLGGFSFYWTASPGSENDAHCFFKEIMGYLGSSAISNLGRHFGAAVRLVHLVQTAVD